MPNWFEKMRMYGIDDYSQPEKVIQVDDGYQVAIKKAKASRELVEKGLSGKEVAYSEPIIDSLSMNPHFKIKPSIRNTQELHTVLKNFSKNIILNSIINIRSNQVTLYAKPVRYSEKGLGYEIRLKDLEQKPTKEQLATMTKIEEFLNNTGDEKDPTRDSFLTFLKKVVRDTYVYDQVNFEKVFDSKGRFRRFTTVDPSTIFFATDTHGKLIKKGERYVQVINRQVVAKFHPKEMAFAVRNPRSDIEVAGYGFSETEIALKQFVAQENTEVFNDRFFSHGGTTRGVLHLKVGQTQSQQALDIFRREWKSSLSGINGSWQIPVISAEDVKFVNMTPSARDMEFEKWLTYLINVICAVFVIDPAEINFPNNGGVSSSKGGSLNEGNSKQKNQASQNKGLMPLLEFIADTINRNIVEEFGDEYTFVFVGGDTQTELEKIEILKEELKTTKTVNEARAEQGKPPIEGGDVILDGVFIQSRGQVYQQQQVAYQQSQDRLTRILENVANPEVSSDITPGAVTYQDVQEGGGGLAGNSDNVNGKGSFNQDVGKDGQMKKEQNTNAGKT